MSNHMLPEQFSDLEPFVGDWALASEAERVDKRYSSRMDNIRVFYDVMVARIENAITHLNELTLHDMPEPEKQLFYMTLSFAEIASAVEAYDQPTVPYGYDPACFPPEAVTNE